ncbi:MAG TPA: S41 family peptidase, partial [Thermoanaerobaculia bacterium]|nr:S41 family peptidase [Thermoanaerobaculia bacterium]
MQGPLSRRLPFLLLSLALVLPLGGALVALDRPGKEPDDDSLFKYLTVFTEAFGLVRNAYVEPTDPERLLARALDGAMDALGPFALFVPAEGVKPYLAAVKVGTGHSGVRLGRERGVTFAVRVEEGSPAAAAEVEPGDILAMIGPDSTRDLAHWEVEARLAGPAGTRLETEWIHHGKPRKVTLELGPYPAAAPTLREERGVAVIRLPWLGEAQVAHFETLLASPLVQRQPRRLLLDLRGTDGSDERLAYRVAGLFADGELGRLTARGKVLERFADESPDRFRGELVVLVDRATIGAGELLAEGQAVPGTTSVVYWDGDTQRELLRGQPTDYQGGTYPPRMEGRTLAVADITGDWREEVITSLPGEVRIYTTTVPATDRRPCLLQ